MARLVSGIKAVLVNASLTPVPFVPSYPLAKFLKSRKERSSPPQKLEAPRDAYTRG